MEVTSASAFPDSGLPAGGPAQPKPTLSSDFETFLKMLTVQMQNQDPLNPVDSSEYAVQLATFSSVEQQVLTNDLLEGIQALMSTSGMAQLSAWIGREVLSEAGAHFSGDPISVHAKSHSMADTAQLVIRDAFDREVQRLPLDAKESAFHWRGVYPSGAAFPHGFYRFEVESFASGNMIDVTAAGSYGRVVEARSGPAGPVVVLQGNIEVPSAAVQAVREAN